MKTHVFELKYHPGEEVLEVEVKTNEDIDVDEALRLVQELKIPNEPPGEPDIWLKFPWREYMKY